MEAVGELAPNQASRLGLVSGVPFQPVPLSRALRAVPPAGRFDNGSRGRPESDGGLLSLASDGGLPSLASDGGGAGELSGCLELLKGLGSTAVEDVARLSFREAAEFAASVEEVSRSLEYLQIVAAGAVDRTRREAQAAARSAVVGSGSAGSGAAVGWVTGWGPGTAAADPAVPPGVKPAGPDPADDGSRNAAEFLRARLRISIAEARRRISLSAVVLPRAGISGHIEPPPRPELAAAVVAGAVASRAAAIITLALDRAGHHAEEETVARMEHALTRTAAEYDTDFLTRVARQWSDAIDQDGSEPSEEELRRRQGVFLRPARRGLQHLEIFAIPEQCEPLLTVMNTATNPRTRTGAADGTEADNRPGCGEGPVGHLVPPWTSGHGRSGSSTA